MFIENGFPIRLITHSGLDIEDINATIHLIQNVLKKYKQYGDNNPAKRPEVREKLSFDQKIDRINNLLKEGCL